MKRIIATAAVCTIGLSTAWALKPHNHEGHDAEATKMKLSNAPTAVQTAIKSAAGSATVIDVEKETEDGITLYEAAWKVGDVDHEVNVNEAGEVMETEMSVSGDAVPAAVKSAAMKHLPKGATAEFEKKMVVLFEIEAMVDGKEVEMLVDPSGRVMELEADDDHEDHDEEDDDDDDEEDDD
tara:strand:+ start:17793 stop:18335 length:543 start_codon:yes stop_codon:yes gene_type:complete